MQQVSGEAKGGRAKESVQRRGGGGGNSIYTHPASRDVRRRPVEPLLRSPGGSTKWWEDGRKFGVEEWANQ